KDQPIIELENEKAVATIPSTASGVISKIHVKNGDKISAGHRLISVTESGGGATPAAAPKRREEARPQARQMAPESVEEAPEEEAVEESTEPVGHANGSVAAAPSIRRMANDLGIDLLKIRGSERGGRIVLSDVRAYIQKLIRTARQPKAAPGAAVVEKPAPERIDFSKWGEISKKPMSSLRKVISRRMVENWNAIPHVTQFDEADLTSVLELRKKYVTAYEQKGARLTVTSFVLKAIVAALKKHPIFNSSLDEVVEEIVHKEYYHIGIAVDTEAGLLVPVIRDVDKKNLVDISKELEELAKKARERKVSSEELKGGTFTISNQGGIGGAHFTPIVNKPEVAILGLGKGAMKPVVRNNAIEPRMMLPIAISYDHRVIDGGTAARFTVDVVQALENFKEEDVKI
ncbi:MAG: Dihydrolipoamide acetyltransferase component of pyruvate dehydrogenase complex, partial [Pedosphaera sp.]|nr:Dihydrolipoamide acetyltransferase component of pyruvate dehydrogenase complex [Pedosphaera sp.]